MFFIVCGLMWFNCGKMRHFLGYYDVGAQWRQIGKNLGVFPLLNSLNSAWDHHILSY